MIPSLVQWIKGTSIAAAAAWISSPGLGNSIYHECNHTKGKKKKKEKFKFQQTISKRTAFSAGLHDESGMFKGR